jgi:glycosyltransferase involved in cell wall biosynthesis
MSEPGVVSVVIPCYNQARYLPQAIESALGQSHARREVVVIDDGATDDTSAVAGRYPDVHCVRQRNQGLSAARNTGLRHSRGDYVVFLDADDRLLPGALEIGASCLARHPFAAFVVGRHRRIAEDGTPLPTPVRPRVERDHYVSLIRRCWITMPATVMYRRARLVQAGAFDARNRCAEDYDVYLRLTRSFPIVDHYAEVAEYRQHGGTLSRDAERMLIATLAVLHRHRPGPDATPGHRAAYRARENAVWYYDRLLDSIVSAARSGQWAHAARSLCVFARLLPRHRGYAARRLTSAVRLALRSLGRRVPA